MLQTLFPMILLNLNTKTGTSEISNKQHNQDDYIFSEYFTSIPDHLINVHFSATSYYSDYAGSISLCKTISFTGKIAVGLSDMVMNNLSKSQTEIKICFTKLTDCVPSEKPRRFFCIVCTR